MLAICTSLPRSRSPKSAPFRVTSPCRKGISAAAAESGSVRQNEARSASVSLTPCAFVISAQSPPWKTSCQRAPSMTTRTTLEVLGAECWVLGRPGMGFD